MMLLLNRFSFLIGILYQGLSYAKEAIRLRTQLFKRKFTFSTEDLVEEYNETGDIGEIAQKVINGPKKLQVHKIVASELWSFDSSVGNHCDCYLSPWNVLQCYLESILQVRIFFILQCLIQSSLLFSFFFSSVIFLFYSIKILCPGWMCL